MPPNPAGRLYGVRMTTTEADSTPEFKPPTCSICQRARTMGEGAHKMDAYDYNPMQVITGQPLGWYSGDDGEVCPEDMEQSVRGQ